MLTRSDKQVDVSLVASLDYAETVNKIDETLGRLRTPHMGPYTVLLLRGAFAAMV